MQRAIEGLAGVFLLLGLSACERNVRLEFPGSTPGEEFVCKVTEGEERCAPQTVIDPKQDNRAHTVFVILPHACQGHFNRITIHDSGSSEPFVNVKCAPPENPIQ